MKIYSDDEDEMCEENFMIESSVGDEMFEQIFMIESSIGEEIQKCLDAGMPEDREPRNVSTFALTEDKRRPLRSFG